MSYSNQPSINFPPGTITSKLSSRMLKQPPRSKDWMHQTYTQMIQDVSYVTSHYYESKENGTSLMGPVKNKPISNSKPSNLSEIHCDSAIVETIINRPIQTKTSPLSIYAYQNDSSDEDSERGDSSDEEDMNDDDESAFCHTATTSSTDCNRKNNIYRFYREQQRLAQPLYEEVETTIRVVPRTSSFDVSEISITPYISDQNHNSATIVYGDTQDAKINKQQKNKKFRKLKRMMTKMRMAAENPFWAIDNRF